MYDELVEKMLRYRAKHNLSQEEFAARCGVTKATIWNLEAGKTKPTNLTKAKIELVIEERSEEHD